MPEPLATAYAACEALARSHYENFPVASRLLPRGMRPHVAAVYAFARVADDIADDERVPPAARQARLDLWQDRVHRAAAGRPCDASGSLPSAVGPRGDGGASFRRDGDATDRDDLIALALGHSIRSLDLPVPLFDDLLSAFGQDTMTTRYDSWVEVFDYCRRSANPIGRVVLQIAGHRDSRLDRLSDAVCTALQLANFWQDFGADWRAGRLYVPVSEQTASGAREAELRSGQMSVAWGQALERCIEVTRAKFDEGRDICHHVGGRLGLELRLTWLGGTRILEKTARARMLLLDRRPALGAADVPVLVWRAARWQQAGTQPELRPTAP